MKNFIKAPENWGAPKVELKAKTLTTNPNRARIEAKIAEIKAKLENKNK